jgi:hypothetical protein
MVYEQLFQNRTFGVSQYAIKLGTNDVSKSFISLGYPDPGLRWNRLCLSFFAEVGGRCRPLKMKRTHPKL